MKRIALSILVIGVLLLSACGAPSETTAPEVEALPTEQPAPTPLREWWEAPRPPLPEGSPPLPPKVIGSATLPRYTGSSTPIKSREFIAGRLPYKQWSDLYVIDIVVESDIQSYFLDDRQPGYINFTISPVSRGFGLEGVNMILENALTVTDEGYVFTNHVRLRIGLDSDTNPLCFVSFMSYDPAQEHEVSWEIYVWE